MVHSPKRWRRAPRTRLQPAKHGYAAFRETFAESGRQMAERRLRRSGRRLFRPTSRPPRWPFGPPRISTRQERSEVWVLGTWVQTKHALREAGLYQRRTRPEKHAAFISRRTRL